MDSTYGTISAFNAAGFVTPQSGWTANSFVQSFAVQGGNQAVLVKLLSGTWTGTLNIYVSSDDGATFQAVPTANILNLTTNTYGAITSAANDTYAVVLTPEMIAPGSVYVGAITAWTGSVEVCLLTGPADEWMDVTTFGAKGDGITADDGAFQMALNAIAMFGSSYNRGGGLKCAPGIYNITNPLVMPTNAINVVIQGHPFAMDPSQYIPRSVLSFSPVSGKTADSMITFSQSTSGQNPPIGFALLNMGLTYTDANGAYTGFLLDFRSNSATPLDSHGVEICNCSFYPSLAASAGNGCSAYLILDGSVNVVVATTSFYGAQYAVQGLAQSTYNTPLAQRGFQSGVTFCNGTQFADQAVAPIRNPGDSWTFSDCIVEPNAASPRAAAFIAMDSGYTCSALSITGGWIGDDAAGAPGTWVEFAGNGLYMAGNYISCQNETYIVSILASTNGSNGIVLFGNNFIGTAGLPSNQAVVNFQALTSPAVNSQFVFLGNEVSNIPGPFSGVIPDGSIYSSANNFLSFTSPTNYSAALNALSQTTGAYEGVNLLSYGGVTDDATFANGFVTNTIGYAKYDWGPNSNITSLSGTTVGSTTAMVMKANATVSSMSVIWPSSNAITNGLRGVPAVAGEMITMLASFYPNSTVENVYVKAYGFPIGSNTPTYITESAPIAEVVSTWTQASLTFEMPAGYNALCLVLVVDTPTLNEEHFVSDVSIAVGNSTTWATPVQTTLLQANGVGLAQVGNVANSDLTLDSVGTGRITVNNNAGGSGGLAVYNGSTIGGPIIGGSLALAVVTPTATYAILTTDNLVECDATSAAFNATLPDATAATCKGRHYTIIKKDSSAHAVTVNTTSSQTLLTTGGTVTSYALSAQGNTISVISDGSNWVITSKI